MFHLTMAALFASTQVKLKDEKAFTRVASHVPSNPRTLQEFNLKRQMADESFKDKWQEDRSQLGTVAPTCQPVASSYSDVLAYRRRTSALRGTVDMLLDTAR